MDSITTTPLADAVPQSQPPKIERFEFRGNGNEYFGIWIVNILLTIVTLGIYSAWAKVRNKRYFYGNTYLAGSSFEYSAQPLTILKGRILAVVLLVLYSLLGSFSTGLALILAGILALFIPAIIVRSNAFNARYSDYRGIHFHFKPNYKDAYVKLFWLPLTGLVGLIIFAVVFAFIHEALGGLVVILGMFLFYPIYNFLITSFVINNHQFGGVDFEFKVTGPGQFIGIYFITGLLGLLAFIILAVIGFVFGFAADLEGLQTGESLNIGFIIIVYLLMGLIFLLPFSYMQSQIYNLTYQNTVLGSNRLRANTNTEGFYKLLLVNNVCILLTLGLFIPWAKVRTARFLAKHTAVQVSGELDEFVATQVQEQGVFGEEIGEAFDIDIGL